MERIVLSLLVAFGACVCGGQAVVNVDVREPILRLSPVLLSDTELVDADDFFGFAIALHQVEEVNPGDDRATVASKTRILVGAPRGTFPGGLNLSDNASLAIPHTGLLYSCPLLPDSDPPCDAVRGDDAELSEELGDDDNNDLLRPEGRLFDKRPNAIRVRRFLNTLVQAESKEGQLLGAFVHSAGDTVIVCAPAWVTSASNYATVDSNPTNVAEGNAFSKGRCYYTGRNLTGVGFLDPCNNENDDTNPSNDRGQGYCNTGTGAAVLSNPRVFVIGSPGYGPGGAGTVFWGSDQLELENRDDNNNFGRGNQCQPLNAIITDLPASSCPAGSAPIIENSQGFRVVTGYITGSRMEFSNPPNVLSSAPRYDNSIYHGKIDVYNSSSIGMLLTDITINGRQMAEFFGYSLATADLNNDQYDDIVVGAPMYSTITTEILEVDIGRVYIFINNEGEVSSEPVILEGSVARGRFGTSVINLGDIDRDGFEDIAVGAPYEPSGSGNSGAVYIFYGREDLQSFPDQIPGKITAQEMVNELSPLDSLKTFGFSLTGHMDVDANLYNDLAIGAFESSTVILLRSLPVANVTLSLSTSSDRVLRNPKDCPASDTYACFEVTVEVGYSGVGLPNSAEVSVVLEEDIGQGVQRIFFDQPSQSEITLTLRPSLTSSDMRVVPVFLLNNSDSLTPLMISGRVLQNELRSTDTPSDGNPQISDLSADFRIRSTQSPSVQVNISNNCGADDICQTDFSLTLVETIILPVGEEYSSIEVGANNRVQFVLSMENEGIEDAIGLFLEVTHSQRGVFSEQFEIAYDNVEIVCNSPCAVSDLPVTDKTRTVTITLSTMEDLTPGSVRTTFSLTSNQTVDDITINNAVSETNQIERRADLAVSASFSIPEVVYSSVVPTEEVSERSDVGIRVTLQVRVENQRSTTINTTMLRIYYPASSATTGNSFFLLPDCGVDTNGDNIVCESSALSESSQLPCSSSKRKRRHIISPVVKQRRRLARQAATASASSQKSVLTRRVRQEQSSKTRLNCGVSPQTCLLVTCNISGLRGQGVNPATVSLVGYVDDRFFAEQSEEFQLTAFASVSFNSAAENTLDHGLSPDNSSTSLNLISESTGAGDSESPAALIGTIVGVVLASILFVLIVAIVLYCCGFFRRKGKAELQSEAQGGVTVTETKAEPKEKVPLPEQEEVL